MGMDKSQASELRDKILEDIKPLMLGGVADGPEKFELLMRIIQTGKATNDIFVRAYDSAKLIEDQEERLDALLSLLDEIDFSSEQKDDNPNSSAEKLQEVNQNNEQGQQSF